MWVLLLIKVWSFHIKNMENRKVFHKKSTDLDRAYNSDQFQLKMGLYIITTFGRNEKM